MTNVDACYMAFLSASVQGQKARSGDRIEDRKAAVTAGRGLASYGLGLPWNKCK